MKSEHTKAFGYLAITLLAITLIAQLQQSAMASRIERFAVGMLEQPTINDLEEFIGQNKSTSVRALSRFKTIRLIKYVALCGAGVSGFIWAVGFTSNRHRNRQASAEQSSPPR